MHSQRAKRLLGLHLIGLSITQASLSILTRRKPKWWVHPAWKNRKSLGAYTSLVKSLSTEDPIFFKKYLRMNPWEFEELKRKVSPFLKKRPSGRKALFVGHRLAITLRFLASGDSMASISFAFRIGFTITCHIIRETCQVIFHSLKPEFLKVPIVNEWADIEEELTVS